MTDDKHAELEGIIRWSDADGSGYEYAIQQGPHGDEFVQLYNRPCLRRKAAQSPDATQMRGLIKSARYENPQGTAENAWNDALEHVEEALSRVSVEAWQPISSAPKDGTCVWIFVPEYEPNEYVASFGSTADLPKDHEDYWEGWILADEILVNHCADELEPTHWMPRPAPPLPEDLSDSHRDAGDGE